MHVPNPMNITAVISHLTAAVSVIRNLCIFVVPNSVDSAEHVDVIVLFGAVRYLNNSTSE